MNLQTEHGVTAGGMPRADIDAASESVLEIEVSDAVFSELSAASTLAANPVDALADAAAAADAEAEALAAALAEAEALALSDAIAFKSSFATAEAKADAEPEASMFTPRPDWMLAIAAKVASVFVRPAAGTFTLGTFIELNACTVALNCPSGLGIGSGNPRAAEKLAKAFICAFSAAVAAAEALADAAADAEADAEAFALALADAEALALAAAEAEAFAFALAAALARAAASSFACKAAAPPGAIRLMPNC